MSIDIHRERLLSLAQAARLLPSRPSPTTMWRWCTRGIRGVRLRSVKIGRSRMTSEEALQEFVSNLNPEVISEDSPQKHETRSPASTEALRKRGLID